MTRWFAAVLAALAFCGAARATTLIQVERTCPIGGARYLSFEIGSTSNFGRRLDLRWIGPEGHLPTVECPNGFVVFKPEEEFTAAEIATLTPVVASAAYQAARRSEPIAARTVLLKRALGTSEADLRDLLLQVAFQAEDARQEDVRQKYLALAASAYDAFLAAHPTPDDDWWIPTIRAAEIARQRGRFDDAIRIADSVATLTPPADGWLGRVAKQIRARAVAKDAAPAPFTYDN